jgi:hypothetical protein
MTSGQVPIIPNRDYYFGPGSIAVVGPKGHIRVRYLGNNLAKIDVLNVDFIGTLAMSDAHKRIVDERWEFRNIDGMNVAASQSLDTAKVPKTISSLFAQSPKNNSDTRIPEAHQTKAEGAYIDGFSDAILCFVEILKDKSPQHGGILCRRIIQNFTAEVLDAVKSEAMDALKTKKE